MFKRKNKICPHWLCFTFDNVFRKRFHKPDIIVGKYISEGDTVLDLGPGKGYFTSSMARLVGAKGKVLAYDVQIEMLNSVRERVANDGVTDRVELHHCRTDHLGLDREFQFGLAFWMYHEVVDKALFMEELWRYISGKGRILVVEPKIHVSQRVFQASLKIATSRGFFIEEEPMIAFSRSALLARRE